MKLAALFSPNTSPTSSPGSAVNLTGRMIEAENPLSVALPTGDMNFVEAVSPDFTAAEGGAPTVLAVIRKLDPENAEATRLRIFVNLPEADKDTRTIGNPNYVTTVAFFGPSTNTDAMDMRPSVAVDLTSTLRALAAAGELSDDLVLQIVLVPGAGNQPPEDVGVLEVELAVV